VLTAFVVVTALAVVLQAGILMAMAIGARKTQERALAIVEELRTSIGPVLANTRDLLEDVAPRVKRITANLEETSEALRAQSNHLAAVTDDVLRRSQRHIAHADLIAGAALDTVDETRASLSRLVAMPLQWVTAIANGLRVGVETFVQRKAGGNPFADGFRAAHGVHDEDREAEEIFD